MNLMQTYQCIVTCLLLCTVGRWCAVHCTQQQCITLCLPADLDQVQNQVLVEVLGLQELQQEVLRLQLQLQLQLEVLRCETPRCVQPNQPSHENMHSQDSGGGEAGHLQ